MIEDMDGVEAVDLRITDRAALATEYEDVFARALTWLYDVEQPAGALGDAYGLGTLVGDRWVRVLPVGESGLPEIIIALAYVIYDERDEVVDNALDADELAGLAAILVRLGAQVRRGAIGAGDNGTIVLEREASAGQRAAIAGAGAGCPEHGGLCAEPGCTWMHDGVSLWKLRPLFAPRSLVAVAQLSDQDRYALCCRYGATSLYLACEGDYRGSSMVVGYAVEMGLLTGLLMMWIDQMMVEVFGDLSIRDGEVAWATITETGMNEYAGQVSPQVDWARKLLNARLAEDREKFYAVLVEVPPGRYHDYVMELLIIVVQTINNAEVVREATEDSVARSSSAVQRASARTVIRMTLLGFREDCPGCIASVVALREQGMAPDRCHHMRMSNSRDN